MGEKKGGARANEWRRERWCLESINGKEKGEVYSQWMEKRKVRSRASEWRTER